MKNPVSITIVGTLVIQYAVRLNIIIAELHVEDLKAINALRMTIPYTLSDGSMPLAGKAVFYRRFRPAFHRFIPVFARAHTKSKQTKKPSGSPVIYLRKNEEHSPA